MSDEALRAENVRLEGLVAKLEAQVKAYAEDDDAEYQDLFKVCMDLEIKVADLKRDYDLAMRRVDSVSIGATQWHTAFKRKSAECRELKSLIKSVSHLLSIGQVDHAKELLV